MAILLIQAVFEFLVFLSRGHSNESPRKDENFSFFVWKFWPFEVEIPVRAIFPNGTPHTKNVFPLWSL